MNYVIPEIKTQGKKTYNGSRLCKLTMERDCGIVYQIASK